MVRTIKSLIPPLIMMAGLALLPACWGLKRPAPVTGTATTGGSCATNPFNEACDETYAIARVLKISECIVGVAAATPTCTDAVDANSCIRDPFAVACATDPTFAAYVDRARSARATYCVTDNANATLCASVDGSALLDTECLDSPDGNPAYPNCSTRPNVVQVCTDAPFTRTGCGNIPTIETLRIAHCEDSATAWDAGCVEETYAVATVARNTACLTHGIDATAGGHADCAERANVLAACTLTSPFAYGVCDAVEDIDMERTTFCLQTTDNGGENPFHVRCKQDTHGDVMGAQETSCLASVDADNGCVALIMQTCTDTPLAGVSCAGLGGHSGFLDAFCMKDNNAMLMGCGTTPAALCPSDPFEDMVTAGDGVIDCLADEDYDSDRQALCASGMEGTNECDTAAIAPAVCASSGPNANPFATFCSSTRNINGGDITAIRQTALSACPDNTNDSDGDICQNTIMARGDLATACALDTNAFTTRCAYTQYETAREGFCPESDPFAYPGCDNVGIINTRRATYCNMPINAWKSDCTGGSFGGTHNPTTAQRDACVAYGTDTNAGGHGTCDTNPEAKSFCETNDPLDSANAGCEDLTNFLMVVRTYCTTRMDQATCKANYADWAGSTFTTQFPLATAPVSTHTTNRFLSGLTATALTDFTLLTTTEKNGQKANTTTSLTLADTDHGFGGESDNGLAFYGVVFNDNIRYYAGIYTDTDLGAPLTVGVQNAVWRAWMRTSGKDPENEAFTLTVSFTESSKAGTLKAFFQSTSGTNTALYYDINGTFNIHGVITGNVAIGTEENDAIVESGDEYTLGGLTGLIGAQGVVAAFVSDTSTITADGGENPFVGGFVGIPALADHDAFSHHYKTQLNTVLTTGDVAFATGSAGGLDTTGLTFDAANQFTSFPVVEEGDGFALLFGQTAGGDDRYRAGLLSGTNLGAPLVDGTVDGDWTGKVYVSRHVDTSDSNKPMGVDLTLAVDFSAGTIGTASAVTTATSETIEIDGLFRAGSNNPTLPLGILGGTVTYNVNTTEHTPLPLIGLIGVEGAIGVFHGGSDIDMVGGFSVSNP